MSNLVEVWSSVEVHPAAELFPMMSDEEYAGLVEDIHQHGQREKIVLWQGQLLDGRNRLKACIELDIEPEVIELPEDADPVAFVCSLNVHRRHLTATQRASIAARLCNIPRGGDRRSKDFKVQNCTSVEDASEMMSVSPRSTKTAKKVQEKADPKIVAKMDAGKISLNAAAKTIDPPATYEVRRDPLAAIKKQIQALEDGPADQLYRWMRHQQASAESESYVDEDGPPLAADDVDLLSQLCESDNAIGVIRHWLSYAGEAKSAIVREFCWGVIEDVDAPGAGASS
jgi:hypothetical protein